MAEKVVRDQHGWRYDSSKRVLACAHCQEETVFKLKDMRTHLEIVYGLLLPHE